MKTAIYPGTFDPFTNGHLDLVTRARKSFDLIIIAVAETPKKEPAFTLDERVTLIREAVKGIDSVDVEPFNCLLVEYAASRNVGTIIRGLRAVSDFEYELQMALMNRKMAHEIETIFLMPSLRYIFLSSTIVREAASFGGDISGLVPPNVEAALVKKYGRSGC